MLVAVAVMLALVSGFTDQILGWNHPWFIIRKFSIPFEIGPTPGPLA